jgi:hypothetical protein
MIAKQQAQEILGRLSFLPFEDCLPMSRSFRQFPELPGIYAIRHQTEGLLYLRKTNNLSNRFNGGHKAFTWAWLDLHNPQDVRIAIAIFDQRASPALLLEIEAILLRATKPPYNECQNSYGEVIPMQAIELEQLNSMAAQVILDQLPDRIKAAYVDRATQMNYPIEAVLEMALAGYLDGEAIGFVDCKPKRGIQN